jgi:hypothetical protein
LAFSDALVSKNSSNLICLFSRYTK